MPKRILDFSDTFSSASDPTVDIPSSNKLSSFASTSAFETDKGSAGSNGDIFLNTTTGEINYYGGGAWQVVEKELNNVTAAAPTVNDDSGSGYAQNSAWVDTSTSPNDVYICVDASSGAAVWRRVYFDDDTAVVTLTGTQTLTNKKYDGGTASDSSKFVLSSAGTSAIDALTDEAGSVYYDTDKNKPVFNDGTDDKELASIEDDFDTSTGHEHDGTDSKKIVGTNIDSTGGTNNQVLVADGVGGISWADQAGSGGIGSFSSYTPTFTAMGTVTGINFRFVELIAGTWIYILGEWTTGTTTASEAQITLPSSYTVLTGTPSPYIAGEFNRQSNWIDGNPQVIATPGDGFVNLALNTTTGNYGTPINGSDLGNSNTFSLKCFVLVE